MTPDRDPFESGQDATDEIRHALEAIRADVRAVVQDEVARAGMSEGELERFVADLVRKNLTEAAEVRPRASVWSAPVLLLTGLVVGLLGGFAGYWMLARPTTDGARPPALSSAAPDPGAATAPTETDASAAPASQGSQSSTSPPPAAAAPTALAARYDSLFAAHDPGLEPLLAELEGKAAPPVLAALTEWRGGGALDPGPRRRLHDALVQAAVNRLAGTALTLDGLVTRNPCGGASCGAILQLWQARGPELGLPAYPAADTARDAALPTVERVLVMRGLEADGG